MTALCSMWLLGRSFSKLKWASLLLLFIGIVCTQVDSYFYEEKQSATSLIQLSDTEAALKGSMSCFFAAFLSGKHNHTFDDISYE
jgi:drug/metabolite transporter (DMT)-like permease